MKLFKKASAFFNTIFSFEQFAFAYVIFVHGDNLLLKFLSYAIVAKFRLSRLISALLTHPRFQLNGI